MICFQSELRLGYVRIFRSLNEAFLNIPDSCQHQHTDGVIHHRFVVDGQQLFANTLGNRVVARAGPSGENYSFYCKLLRDIRNAI